MVKSNKTLLIIGAGREQVEAYQTARKMGLKVIGTDINPKPLHLSLQTIN